MGNKNGYGAGTFVETRLALSKAYLTLGQKGSAPVTAGCSAQMLMLLLLKREFKKVKSQKSNSKSLQRVDDNLFKLSYKELANRGISQTRATRGFDELLAKGFIEIMNPGGLYVKDSALYALCNDYLNWKPGDPPKRVRKRDVHRGFQGKEVGAVKNKLRARQRGTPTRTSTPYTSTKDTHVNNAHPQNDENLENARLATVSGN